MLPVATRETVQKARLAPQASVAKTWRWRQACALGLSTTYAALFLLASLCLATGFLHTDVPHDPYQHHHTHPDAEQSSALPDICDFVLQALITTELQTMHFPSRVLPPGNVLVHAPTRLTSLSPAASYTIRAPPTSHS